MGLRFEAWTLPSSGTFEKKFDIPHVLPGASGVRELSNYSDESITVPASWKNLPNLVSETVGSLIRVFNGTSLVDEFEPVRVDIPAGRPNVRTISGPQRNGLVEGIGVAPKNYPNHKDGDLHWQWGAKNLLPDLSLAGLGSVREVWEVWHDHTSGQWNAEVGGDDVDLDYDATPAEIEGSNIGAGSGIQGLTTVEDVTVSGEGSEDDPWIITFYNPADPTGVVFTAGTLSGGTTFSATRTTAGALDPHPITIAKPVDAQAGDGAQHGRYENPPIRVDKSSGEQDGTSEWVLRVDVTSGFGGSQYFPIDVVAGKTYSNITARVKPEDAGRYGLIIRDEFSGDIYRQFQDMTAGTWQDLTPATITIPPGVNRVLMRVSVDDDDTPTTFRVNWQHATFLEGEPEASFTKIVRQLLEAAQDRNVGTWMELDATDAVDSNGTSLNDISFTVFVGDGTHLGHVLDEGKALGYQWRIVPADEATQITPSGGTTHVLQIFFVGADEIEDLTANPGGPSVTVGDHVRSAQVVSRRLPYTSLIGLGSGSLSVEDSHAAAVSGIGRIERVKDVEHLSSTASIQSFLDAQFAEQSRNQKAATATVVEGGRWTPLLDYAEGSKIWWQFPGILTREARAIKRVAWIHGSPTEYQLQGSRILTGEAALAAGVDRLLRAPGRRRDDGTVAVPPVASGGASPGAHIHVSRVAAFAVGSGGDYLEWDTYGVHHRFNFPDVAVPSANVVIQEPGYYSVNIKEFVWDEWTGGGTLRIILTNSGGDLTVGEWTHDSSSRFEDGGAHFIPCQPGDIIRLWVDHGDSSSHDVASAELAVGLIDHYGSRAPQEATAGVIDEAITTFGSSGVTSGALNMTTGQEPGDVMLMMLSSRSESGDTFPASFPSGWTLLVNKFEYGNKLMSLLYKVCDGSEPASYTLTSSQATRWTGAVWVVRSDRDYSVTPPVAGTPAAQESDTGSVPVDPPPVSPGTPGTYLVFACAAHSHAGFVPTGGPDNYELSSVLQSNLVDGIGLSNSAGLDVWRRLVNISTSEDPGPIFYEGDFGRSLAAVAVAVRV